MKSDQTVLNLTAPEKGCVGQCLLKQFHLRKHEHVPKQANTEPKDHLSMDNSQLPWSKRSSQYCPPENPNLTYKYILRHIHSSKETGRRNLQSFVHVTGIIQPKINRYWKISNRTLKQNLDPCWISSRLFKLQINLEEK